MGFFVIVGKAASVAGSVLMGASSSLPGCPGQTHYVPHKTHRPDETFLTAQGHSLPQVPETFGYVRTACTFPTGTRPYSWVNGMNEKQVSVGSARVYSFRDEQIDRDRLETDDLILLLLERASSARQGIEMLGELIAEYGYSRSTLMDTDSSAVLAVSDPNEGYFMELVPGGHWAARRVADDEVECRPDCYGIQTVDFEDHENFLYSPGLKELAAKQGDEPFNFAKTFGTGANEGVGFLGPDAPVNRLRRWSCLNRLCDLDTALDAPVYSGKAKRRLRTEDIMDMLRDTLAGTKYDLSRRPEAGTYHNPFWQTVSDSIAAGGNVNSMVFEPRVKSCGCMWVAPAVSRISCFMPVFPEGGDLPAAYRIGEQGEYDLRSAWWAFEDLAEVCYRNYDAIARDYVIPRLRAMEAKNLKDRKELDVVVRGMQLKEKAARLKQFSDRCATEAYLDALKTAKYIKGKYLCNFTLDWL